MIQMKTLPQPQPTRAAVASGARGEAAPIVAGACPFLDRNDARCASRFGLDRIDEMMEICLGAGVAGCFMHHRIRHEDAMATDSRLVTPTHDGHPLRLRPTGS
jgi:hypothetical protein